MNTFKNFSLGSLHNLKSPMTISLLAVILSFIGWVNFDKIQSIQNTQSRLYANLKLEDDVHQLRSTYFQTDPNRLEKDLHRANLLLLQNFTHLTEWAQMIQTHGKAWNLHTQYRIIDTKRIPAPLEGVRLVPLEILIIAPGTGSAYRPYLNVLKYISESGPRVDIHDVTITGDGHRANHLKVGLSVWMKTIESVKL